MDKVDKHSANYDRLFKELWEIAHEDNPWYDVDKVKDWGVYIWTKGKYGKNVFDIGPDEIWYYVDDHVIPDEAWSFIHKIQAKLREIRDYVYDNADDVPQWKWLKEARLWRDG